MKNLNNSVLISLVCLFLTPGHVFAASDALSRRALDAVNDALSSTPETVPPPEATSPDCQTAPKIDPQSASNFDPLELSAMASPRGRGGGSLLASVFEPPAVVAGLDDLAMMGHPIQERRGHFGVAKDLAPLAKGQVGRHQDRRPFVEL